MPAYRQTKDAIILYVRITPNAAHDRIEGEEMRDNGQAVLRIRVKAIPDKGKANNAVIALLAKNLELPKQAFNISTGHKARIKTIKITGPTSEIIQTLVGLLKPNP